MGAVRPPHPGQNLEPKPAGKHTRPAQTQAAVDRRADGRRGRWADPGKALPRAGMPVYFPRLVVPSLSSPDPYCSAVLANCNDGDEPATVYTHAYPRQYDDRCAWRHALPRLSDDPRLNYALDEFYGVQGTTWNDPPLLSSPSGTRTVNGRKLFLYKDGSKLTTVAWHHDGHAYWISNTLTESLTNNQMLSIAASLTRYKG